MLTLLLLACGGADDTDSADTDTADTDSADTDSADSGETDTGDSDTGHPWNPASTVCGHVARGDCPGLPATVRISSVLDGADVCHTCSYDTGGGCVSGCDTAGDCPPWEDEVVAEPLVDAEGYFEATLPAGAYGASAYWDSCTDCASVTVTGSGCASVALEGIEHVSADKPNVYLYPEVTRGIHVGLGNPGMITASDPQYGADGWTVRASPDGELRTPVGPRDYLFYELAVDAAAYQRHLGWCASRHIAQASIEDAMVQLGFNEPEIVDFADYWDSAFPSAAMITIYPQVDHLPALTIEPAPDVVLRAWFVVEAGCHPVVEPELRRVERTGYHAAEWGLIVLPPLERVEGGAIRAG